MARCLETETTVLTSYISVFLAGWSRFVLRSGMDISARSGDWEECIYMEICMFKCLVSSVISIHFQGVTYQINITRGSIFTQMH